eukprot:TRINITY_DN1457_c1_g1_i1.p1 TRINITY_DN1457_c1_g1~~TRINITY_DN1457_c1_g1_i1.p1  ORF type:complete len:905 (-),score=172.94 TRINITY_DN1457_c1_g1_i1:48-2762(-)
MEKSVDTNGSSQFLAQLGTFEASQPSFAGRKCANLSHMKRAGFQVPRGFGIAGQYFLSFLKANGISPTDPDFRFIVSAAKTWPNDLDKLITEHLNNIIDSMEESTTPITFAVRSSGMEEDSDVQAFAGMHDTILNVEKDQVHNAIKSCWASALNQRVGSYATDLSYLPPFGVVVQVMIDAQVAGVAFTRDPLTGDDEFFILNFAKGLGEQVVSGTVIPEQANLPRDERAARRISHPLLSYSMFEEMRKSLLLVEALFGTPQDIEWCFDHNDSLWLLQSRPITTLSNDYLSVSEHLELPLHITKDVLSSKATMESMSFVPTALTWTTFSEVIDTALQQRYAQKGIDYYKFCGENRSFYELRQGRVYQNVTLTCELNREEFGIDFTSTAESFDLDSSSLAELLLSSHQSKASAPGSVSGSFSLLKTLWSSGTVASQAASAIERELDYCVAERKRLKEALGEFESLSDVHSSFEVLLDRFKDLATTYIDVTIHASIFEAAISTFLGAENRHLMAPLTANLGGVYTALQNEKLLKVAKELELLLPIKKDLVVSLMEKTADAPHESLKKTVEYVENFLDQFGFRGEIELEVSCPRWWDNPSRFLDMIHIINSNLENKSASSTAPAPRVEKDKETIIYEMSNFMTRSVLRWAVNQLNALMRLRENGKYVVVFFIALSRMIIAEAANRFVKSGTLSNAEDVFQLPLNDFRQLFRGLLNDSAEIKRCISSNLALRRRWIRSPIQREIIGFKAVTTSKKHQNTSNDGEILKGTAASPGVVEGEARVIWLDDQSVSDSSLYQRPEVMRFRDGEILVTRTTNPAWTPLFLKSKAVVVEFGGLLSHGAITARELGLPAVVAVRDISKISTGDTILVDGDQGTIKILKRAPVSPVIVAKAASTTPVTIVPNDQSSSL